MCVDIMILENEVPWGMFEPKKGSQRRIEKIVYLYGQMKEG